MTDASPEAVAAADPPYRGWSRGDVVLVVLGLAFGALSLWYPFGRDQGLYYYVGREWALHGSIPYRDVFDHKTPGIYILHAAMVVLFGDVLWGIRIAELACVVWAGLVIASLVTPASRPVPRGLRGLAVFVTSVLYYGFLDFRETAEGEIWLATMSLAACALLRRWKRTRTAIATAGALSAAAFLMKPSALPLILVVIAMTVVRLRGDNAGRRQYAEALGLFAAGGLALVVPIFGYLAAHHAMPAFFEIVVGANRFYVKNETAPSGIDDMYGYYKWYLDWYQPVMAVLFFGLGAVLVQARRAKDAATLRAYGVVLASLVASWASVAMQGKYYLNHWGVMTPALALASTALAVTYMTRARAAHGPLATVPACAAMFLVLYAMTGRPFARYTDVLVATVKYAVGSIPEEEYATHFIEHGAGARCSDNVLAARWLREHSTENDYIAVRGFQPQIYAFAKRRYPGRFFWTTFMLSPTRAWHGAEWLAEDRRALSAHPPQVVLTITVANDGSTDTTDWWLPFGYTKRVTIGDFDLLERTPETATETL